MKAQITAKTKIGKAREIYAFFLEIFFPRKCICCGQYGELVCSSCLSTLERIQTLTCPECGKISQEGRYCDRCRRRDKPSLDSLLIAARYDVEPLKKIIHDFKYLGLTDLAHPLGKLIAQQIQSRIKYQDCLVVPVPLFHKKKNRRGFNQSELIARDISRNLGLHGGNALVRVRDTGAQAKLSRVQRLKNVTDAFVCADAELIAGKSILLIDDVATTGTTLNECAKALKNAGAKKVYGIVAARNI